MNIQIYIHFFVVFSSPEKVQKEEKMGNHESRKSSHVFVVMTKNNMEL